MPVHMRKLTSMQTGQHTVGPGVSCGIRPATRLPRPQLRRAHVHKFCP